MSKQTKLCTAILGLLFAGSAMAQTTLEMTTRNFVGTPPVGPTTSPIGPISFEKDQNNNNQFSATGSQDAVSVTFTLANQQYTGLSYSNISTGLVFGGSPTTAVDVNFPATQQVDPNDTYNLLGSFSAAVGGPTNNMFTSNPNATPTVQSGTGIIAGGVVRQVIGVTGIRNMLSKSLGSTNKVNIAYATIKALQSLVPRDEWLNAPKKKPAKKEEDK